MPWQDGWFREVAIGGFSVTAVLDDERVVASTRMHVRALLRPGFVLLGVLAFVAADLAAGALAALPDGARWAARALLALVAARALWLVLAWSRARVTITTARLVESAGIVRARVWSAPLDAVSDVHHRRSLAGALFGYGELVVEVAGSVRRFEPVPRPGRLAQLLLGTSALASRARRTPVRRLADEALAVARHTTEVVRAHTATAVLGGRYRITAPIASGGMGRVFVAADERLRREVAVKVLREELAGDGRFLERFRREALASASLSHPSIASIFDYGEHDGRPYIVMELVRGDDLASVLEREGRLHPTRAARVAGELLGALQHAHDSGVIHRDVKPANVIVCPGDRVKVTDFGIAQAAGASRLTASGIVVGSAHYIAPEQVEGRPATARSDVYSAGVVLFEMLTGAPPFRGDTAIAVAERHVAGRVPPPSRLADVPTALDLVVARATATVPRDRFASADEMAVALHAVFEPSPARVTAELRRPRRARRERVRREGVRFDTPPLRS